MSTNTVNPQPLLSYHEMGAVRVTPEGVVSWGGVAMNPGRVYPEVPGMIFDAPGRGYYPVNGPGERGFLDVWFTTSAIGSARDICVLLDATGLTKIMIGQDAAGHITADVWNAAATSVASFVGTDVIATGTRLHVRLAWNSVTFVAGTMYVDLQINGQAASGVWTGGTTPWTHFVGTTLSVGGLPPIVSATNPFNGTIENAQLGIG